MQLMKRIDAHQVKKSLWTGIEPELSNKEDSLMDGSGPPKKVMLSELMASLYESGELDE